MNEISLDKQLAAIREACAATTELLARDLQATNVDRVAAQSELEALRRRLESLTQQERMLQADLVVQAQRCADEQRDAGVMALRASYASILAMRDYWLQRARLESQIQTLWATDSLLQTRLEAYRKLEENADTYLATFPELVRDAMSQALRGEQDKLGQQIAPWLDLQAQRQTLRPECPLKLQLLVAHEPGDALIAWVLPFPANPAALPKETAPILSELADTMLKALSRFGMHSDWNIDDLDSAGWEDFSVVLALASYHGKEPLAEAARELLEKLLLEAPIFHTIALDLHVVELPYEAWRRGRQGEGTSLGADDQIVEAEVSTPDRSPLAELSQGWYLDDDVRGWNDKKGKLAPQARRLRTLLMRMVGRGMVGGDAAPIEALWEALPQGHDSSMRVGIEMLANAGLLLKTTSFDQTPGVTINAAMLDEVQRLINRDVSPFWIEMLNETAVAQ
jgi:hypothetical protein